MTAAHVISTEKFLVGVINRRERDRSQVSDGKIEWVPRASVTAQQCVRGSMLVVLL